MDPQRMLTQSREAAKIFRNHLIFVFAPLRLCVRLNFMEC
jgi:hypothetical protein